MLLIKYSPKWIQDFKNIELVLNGALNTLSVKIEHVGSTAVPNLDAKPIIDIDIIFNTEMQFAKIKRQLEALGYYHNGNQGITDRDVFKRADKSFHAVLDTIQHHLYVCPWHSVALQRHLLTRNYLRNNPKALHQYQQMKYDIAVQANQDKKQYAALKELTMNAFIDQIIMEQQRAEARH